MKNTILVVDNDMNSLRLLRKMLQAQEYRVVTARTGRRAMEKARSIPDLITLDVPLPDMDGWHLATLLKHNSTTSTIPLLFVTDKTSETDEVIGFDLGAVDYIKKPVIAGPFLARVRSILRWRKGPTTGESDDAQDRICFKDLEIDIASFTVRINKQDILFAKKEFELLAYLAQHEGRVISRETLLESVWGGARAVYPRTLDVHIRKIREKLGTYAGLITTRKRVGYSFSFNSIL